jgi:hypothetical protein
VSPVRCELGFYISKDGILHSHRQDLKSYILFISLTLFFNVSSTMCCDVYKGRDHTRPKSEHHWVTTATSTGLLLQHKRLASSVTAACPADAIDSALA